MPNGRPTHDEGRDGWIISHFEHRRHRRSDHDARRSSCNIRPDRPRFHARLGAWPKTVAGAVVSALGVSYGAPHEMNCAVAGAMSGPLGSHNDQRFLYVFSLSTGSAFHLAQPPSLTVSSPLPLAVLILRIDFFPVFSFLNKQKRC